MLVRAIFTFFVLLALLGDARIFLFILNRVVFGSHRHEKNPWGWLLIIVFPLLLTLTAFFWPVGRWIDTPAEPPLFAQIGAAWLIAAAAVGGYWILDRIRVHAFGVPPLAGVVSQPSVLIRLRKVHVPIVHNEVYDIEVTRHEIFIDDLAEQFDGFRIAFLTDTHVASFMRRNFYREIVEQVNRFEPDVILLGGDFVTWHKDIPLLEELLLADLRARRGIFAVLGNHDYWAGGDDVRRAMSAKGVRFLINESVALPLPILGIDEIYRGDPDVEKAFASVEGPCIGISHHPDVIDLLGGHRIDLLLCGHTHGGQIRFPFFGAVVVPSRHEAAYAAGFHRVRNVLMYVSRGIGAVPPIRILCRPEVATFVLRRGARRTT